MVLCQNHVKTAFSASLDACSVHLLFNCFDSYVERLFLEMLTAIRDHCLAQILNRSFGAGRMSPSLQAQSAPGGPKTCVLTKVAIFVKTKVFGPFPLHSPVALLQ